MATVKNSKKSKNTAKKAMLKKLISKNTKTGASPIAMDNGLGKTPLDASSIGSGGGTNLGTNGIF